MWGIIHKEIGKHRWSLNDRSSLSYKLDLLYVDRSEDLFAMTFTKHALNTAQPQPLGIFFTALVIRKPLGKPQKKRAETTPRAEH